MKSFEYWLIDSTSQLRNKNKQEVQEVKSDHYSDLTIGLMTTAVLYVMEKYNLTYEQYVRSDSNIVNTPVLWQYFLPRDIAAEFHTTTEESKWFKKHVEPHLLLDVLQEWENENT